MGCPAPRSARVALLQSAAWLPSRAPRVAPVGNGLTLGCGVQPRCGWRTANTAAALRQLERRGSICYNATNCRDWPSRQRRSGPAGWNTETRTKACTGVADPVGNQWMRHGRRPGDAGRYDSTARCGRRMEAWGRSWGDGAAAWNDERRWTQRGSALEFTPSACVPNPISRSSSEFGSRTAR